MYFNNIHIIFYLLIAFLGFGVGKFVAWCNIRFPEDKKYLAKIFLKRIRKEILKVVI